MPDNLDPSETDLYSDSAAPASDAEAAPAGDTEESDGATTAVLPLSFFDEGVQPGDTCTVTVVRVHDDQVEVKYDKSAESEESYGEGEEAGAEAPPPGEMASMME